MHHSSPENKQRSEGPNYSVDKVQIKETSNGRLIAQVARNTKCKNEWGQLGAFLKGRLCRGNVGPCWVQCSDRNVCKWRGRWMRGSAELQWSKTLVQKQSPSSALFINTPTTQMNILSCCSKATCCYLFIFLQLLKNLQLFFTVTMTVSLQNHYKSGQCDRSTVIFVLFIYYYSIHLYVFIILFLSFSFHFNFTLF